MRIFPPPKSITAADGKRVKIYFVKENDGAGVFLNYELLKKQKCTSQQIKNILDLAKTKRTYYKLMEMAFLKKDVKELRHYARIITTIEYQLQFNWNFKKNKKYHRFWEAPGCQCPKIDNADNWPSGYYIISENCLIHGKKK